MRPKAEKFAAETNRNTMHKTLFDENVTDERTLLENFDSCTPDQLAQLRRASCWTNPDRCPVELIPQLQEQLLQKPNKATVFEKRRHEVLPLLLFKQFDKAATRFVQGTVPLDLLHNFRRESRSYTRLFEWGPYETIQRIIGPVHFNIHVKGGRSESMHPLVKRATIGSLVDLQNILIQSHSRVIDMPCSELIRHVENYLNATLQQVKVRGNRLLFIFEWSEAPQFDYALCFDMRGDPLQPSLADTRPPEKEKKRKKKKQKMTFDDALPTTQMLTMGREDLFDGVNASDKERCTVSDTRERVRDAKLAYFFNAFIRRDE